jgi:hypothetical protein
MCCEINTRIHRLFQLTIDSWLRVDQSQGQMCQSSGICGLNTINHSTLGKRPLSYQFIEVHRKNKKSESVATQDKGNY